jgi:ribosome biogenesis SPOUT family RNA methylase Rps3
MPRIVVGGVSLSEPERHRAYIAALQRDLNRHLRRLGAAEQLGVDGCVRARCVMAIIM